MKITVIEKLVFKIKIRTKDFNGLLLDKPTYNFVISKEIRGKKISIEINETIMSSGLDKVYTHLVKNAKKREK